MFEDGDYSSIDVPDGRNTAALGINNNGDIVGWYERNINGVFGHGFLYSEGQFLTIDEPDSMLSTIPFGINDRGDIVGSYIPADRTNHGFLATSCQ